MAAGSAAERAEAKGRASARKRGREVCLPVSHLVLCLSLCLFGLLLCLFGLSLCLFCLSFCLFSSPGSLVWLCMQPSMLTLCLLLSHVHWTMLSHSYQNGLAVLPLMSWHVCSLTNSENFGGCAGGDDLLHARSG